MYLVIEKTNMYRNKNTLPLSLVCQLFVQDHYYDFDRSI